MSLPSHSLDNSVFTKNGKMGVRNNVLNTILIPPIYDDVFVPEVMGWIMVKKDGEWGYIDEQNDYTNDINETSL